MTTPARVWELLLLPVARGLRAMKSTRATVAAIAIAGMGMACCEPTANDNPAPADVQLTAGDLSGPFNLSNGDRMAFTDKCAARRADLFANFTAGSSIKPADIRELRNHIDETFPRFCDCLVKGLEKGLSKIQFMMAERMIGQGIFISYPGSPMPEFEALKKAAAQRGMSANDFESARQKFRIHASHSAEACFLTLWAPLLAR
jgi:hypothetical protein